MSKKSTKVKTKAKPTAKKPMAFAFDLEKKSWTNIDNKEQLESYLTELSPHDPLMTNAALLESDGTRIVVAVAETVLNGKIKLECGRAAAQAAHAVSKLKLSWVTWQCMRDGSEAYKKAATMRNAAITTIVLKVRNSEELQHIERLAIDKNLHYADFYDTNDQLYGKDVSVLTAVAIGPIYCVTLAGVTDYLPLWKCACDPVR